MPQSLTYCNLFMYAVSYACLHCWKYVDPRCGIGDRKYYFSPYNDELMLDNNN